MAYNIRPEFSTVSNSGYCFPHLSQEKFDELRYDALEKLRDSTFFTTIEGYLYVLDLVKTLFTRKLADFIYTQNTNDIGLDKITLVNDMVKIATPANFPAEDFIRSINDTAKGKVVIDPRAENLAWLEPIFPNSRYVRDLRIRLLYILE